MVVKVQWDQSGLRHHVEAWTKKQMPFVLSFALNLTVKEAQLDARDELPKSFTIRNKRTAKGVRRKNATKAAPEASIGTIDEYMRNQVFGGTSRGAKESVPMLGNGRGRPRKKSKAGEKRWPGAMRARVGKGFWKDGRRGAKLLYLPRGEKGLLLAYVIVPQVEIKKSSWDIERILEKTAAAEWTDNAKIAWKRAIKTARR